MISNHIDITITELIDEQVAGDFAAQAGKILDLPAPQEIAAKQWTSRNTFSC
ncbi:hypothetical protein ACO2I3_06185 [Leptospira interrogans]